MATLVNRLFNNGNLSIAGTLNETLVDTPKQGFTLLSAISGYYYYPLNNVFNIGTGAFTIECWVWPNSMQAWSLIFGGVNYGNSSDWGLYAGNGTTAGQVMFQFTNTGTQKIQMTGTISTGTWTHIAVSRDSGGTARLFINGTLNATVTGANAWSLSNSLQKSIFAGYNGNSNTQLKGYISSLRIINGTAVYTQSFTPSTSALPATQLANTYGSPSAAIPSGQCVLLLDAYAGTGATDSSGNNLSGTSAGLGGVVENDLNSPFPAQIINPSTVSYTSGNIATKGRFDEYTLNPIAGGLARRQLPCGTLQVAGQFDEVTINPTAPIPYTINYFVVGGGGAGGVEGGGGGAGGIATGSIIATHTVCTYTVTVGGGGAGVGYATPAPGSFRLGNSGVNSSITGGNLAPTNYIGLGGGGGISGSVGAGTATPGASSSGGSGGGGGGFRYPFSCRASTCRTGGSALQPSSPSGGFGNSGGSGSINCAGNFGSGGGGGAGGVGGCAPLANPSPVIQIDGGLGGAGRQYAQFAPYGATPGLSGYPGSGWFAGGGGGGGVNGYGGTGGAGGGGLGGGAGTSPSPVSSVVGATNTGGGGGGGSGTASGVATPGNCGWKGAAGGSGIVIMYYCSPTQKACGGTVVGGPAGPVFYHVFTGLGSFKA